MPIEPQGLPPPRDEPPVSPDDIQQATGPAVGGHQSAQPAPTDGAVDTFGRVLPHVSVLVGLAGSFLSGLAVIGGGAERLLRERFVQFVFVSVLVVVGLLLLALAIAVRNSVGRRKTALLLGVTSLAVASVTAFVSAASIASVSVRPNITTTVARAESGGLRLSGTVDSSGLRATQYLRMIVVGYGQPSGRAYVLRRSDAGPRADGTASIPIAVDLDRTLYDQVAVTAWVHGGQEPDCNLPEQLETALGACYKESLVDAGSLRPELTAQIDGSGAGRALVTTVKMAQLPKTEAVRLSVTAVGRDGEVLATYVTPIAPTEKGAVDHTARLPLPPGYADVCAVAVRYRLGTTPDTRSCSAIASATESFAAWLHLVAPAEEAPTPSP